MGSAVVPTFHNATHGILKSPTDVALYLIRWPFANPGATSSQLEDEMISFRELEAVYGKSPDDLCREISNRLKVAMDHYFPEQYNVNATYEEETDGSGKYSISIDISDNNGQPICRRHMIEVNADGDFTIHAEGEVLS